MPRFLCVTLPYRPPSPEKEPSFSVERFCEAMETIEDQTLRELLEYLDQRDITMSRAYIESCMVPEDFPQDLTHIAESVVRKVSKHEFSFANFLEM